MPISVHVYPNVPTQIAVENSQWSSAITRLTEKLGFVITTYVSTWTSIIKHHSAQVHYHLQVLGLASQEGEEVRYVSPVVLKDRKINEWLTLVEKEMRITLAKLLASAVQDMAGFR